MKRLQSITEKALNRGLTDKLCELGQEALGKEDNETAYCCFLCASALGSEKGCNELGNIDLK